MVNLWPGRAVGDQRVLASSCQSNCSSQKRCSSKDQGSTLGQQEKLSGERRARTYYLPARQLSHPSVLQVHQPRGPARLCGTVCCQIPCGVRGARSARVSGS